MKVDATPILAEILAFADWIHPKIDEVYKQNPTAYYAAAKDTEYYDSYFAKKSSLVYEEYYRKVLGVICAEQDITLISKLLVQGYNKVYRFLKNRTEIDSKEINQFLSNMKSDDELWFANFSAFYFICRFYDIKVNPDDFFETILFTYMQELSSIETKTGGYDLVFNTNLYKEQIKSTRKKVKNVIQSYLKEDMAEKGILCLYLQESMDFSSLFRTANIGDQDIAEIIAIYEYCHSSGRFKWNFEDYVICAFHIKLLLKNYKMVKDMYFKNNKETMYVEFAIIEEKCKSLRKENAKLKSTITGMEAEENQRMKSLQNENEILQKQIARLEQSLHEQETNTREASRLREYIYNTHNQSAIEQPIDKINLDDKIESIKALKIVVVGGHVKWHEKIRTVFPDWKFLSPETLSIKGDFFRYKDLLLINTGYLSHALYNKVMRYAEQYQVAFTYTDSSPIDRIIYHVWHEYKNDGKK